MTYGAVDTGTFGTSVSTGPQSKTELGSLSTRGETDFIATGRSASMAPSSADPISPPLDLKAEPKERPRPKGIELALIVKAQDILDSIDPGDPLETALQLTAFAGTVMEVWESAETASAHHCDILAILENAAILASRSAFATDDQLRAFREALVDLRQDRLVAENVEIIRGRFLHEGFPPLGYAQGSESDDDDSAG